MHKPDIITQLDNAQAAYILARRRMDHLNPADKERVKEACMHSRNLTRLLESQGAHIDPIPFMHEESVL